MPTKEVKPNTLLLIRLDAIGDYVMFHNFIQELKESQKYKDYKITLLGNCVWKGLAEELDSDYIDSFIWLDRKRFNIDFIYRYKKLTEITSQGYKMILSPVFSREFFYADAIVKLVKAKEKIGSIGDLSNIKRWQKNISDKYYDKLIKADENIIFEFYRNKEFFENLLETKLDIVKPTIQAQHKKLGFELPNNYAILFIGASVNYRKWDIEKFAKAGEYLKEKYGYGVILCGGPEDNEDAKEFEKKYDGEFLNLVGKTSLVELLTVIYNGNLMISNETSAPHFAVALEMKNVFVIYNGNHYGRFTPYPKAVSEDCHVIFHPEIEKDLDDHKNLSNSYGYGSDLNINDISVEIVKKKISNILNIKHKD